MAARTIQLPIILLIISCFLQLSLSNPFKDENPIKLISDGFRDFHSSVFSIMDGILDDLSFAHLISPPVEAIYQFGDSINDAGNLARDEPQCNYNKFPYGETYFHQPTGRCSNGLVMVDYFAEFLKLPLVDAYLNKDGNFTHGVNFAVAGATALDVSTLATKYNVNTQTNRSLSVQLGWFKSHIGSNCLDESECKQKVANGLILMGEIGGNDYNFAFFGGQAISEVYKLVPEVVQTIKRAVQVVIELGATRIVVPGNFPVGCMTIYLALYQTNNSSMYDKLGCLVYLNDFAKFHNDQLQEAIRGLRKDYPNVAIVYGDYYAAMRFLLNDATNLGFDENVMYKACCGEGDNDYNFGYSKFCGTDGAPVCKNHQEHVSWDGIHLTQHAYEVMVKWLMRDILFGIANSNNVHKS